jgi:hypothetical protein
MKHPDSEQDPRRRLLMQALTTGLFSSALPGANALADSLFGSKPAKLPAGQSIYRITGEALVNGKTATLETRIKPGDSIATGKDSELIFVIGSHAMLLRDQSQLVITAAKESATALLISALRLLQGKLLSVSRHTPLRVETATATIGIRGTGFYAESAPEQSYFCTCYGVTDVMANTDPESTTSVTSSHHDRPLYILKNAARGQHILDAPFINHTDQELALIETLVGRTTPFVFSNDAYRTPRREY